MDAARCRLALPVSTTTYASQHYKPCQSALQQACTHLVEDGHGVEHKGDGEAGDGEGTRGEQHGLDPALALVARVVAPRHVAARQGQGDRQKGHGRLAMVWSCYPRSGRPTCGCMGGGEGRGTRVCCVCAAAPTTHMDDAQPAAPTGSVPPTKEMRAWQVMDTAHLPRANLTNDQLKLNNVLTAHPPTKEVRA